MASPRSEPLLWLQLLGLGVLPLEALLLLLLLAGADPGPAPSLERLFCWAIGALLPAYLLWRRPADGWSLLLLRAPLRGRRPLQLRLSSLQAAPLLQAVALGLGCVLSFALLWWCDNHAAVASAYGPLPDSPRLVALLLAAALLALIQWQWQQWLQALWLLSRPEQQLAAAAPMALADLERQRLSLGIPLLLLAPLSQEPEPSLRAKPPSAKPPAAKPTASSATATPPAGSPQLSPAAPPSGAAAAEEPGGSIGPDFSQAAQGGENGPGLGDGPGAEKGGDPDNRGGQENSSGPESDSGLESDPDPKNGSGPESDSGLENDPDPKNGSGPENDSGPTDWPVSEHDSATSPSDPIGPIIAPLINPDSPTPEPGLALPPGLKETSGSELTAELELGSGMAPTAELELGSGLAPTAGFESDSSVPALAAELPPLVEAEPLDLPAAFSYAAKPVVIRPGSAADPQLAAIPEAETDLPPVPGGPPGERPGGADGSGIALPVAVEPEQPSTHDQGAGLDQQIG